MLKRYIDKSVFAKIMVGFLYFAISNLSRMLVYVGIPREVCYLFFLLILSLFIIRNLRILSIVDLLYYGFVISNCVVGLLRYGGYIESRTSRLSVVIIFLPAYIFFKMFDNTYLKLCFDYAAIYSTLYLIFFYFVVIRHSSASYSMSYAYWTTFPIVALFNIFLDSQKKICLLGMTVLFGTLVLVGCRGALLLTIVTLFYLYITKVMEVEYNSRKFLIIVIIATIIIVCYFNIDYILRFLSGYASISRNIRKLLSGNMLDSSSREGIYSVCKAFIEERPLGYGVLASRKILFGHNYPHSMWYEFQLDYGRCFGIFLFLLLWFMNIMNLIRYRKTKYKSIIAYIGIIGMGSLMVSSSYLYEMYIPATIAMFLNYNRNVKGLEESNDIQ